MNVSHLEHALYALGMQLIVAFATGSLWMGAIFASAFFLGREHAQAESRYLRASTGRKWPELHALHPRWWNIDSVLDWVVPVVVVAAIASLAQLASRG